MEEVGREETKKEIKKFKRMIDDRKKKERKKELDGNCPKILRGRI